MRFFLLRTIPAAGLAMLAAAAPLTATITFVPAQPNVEQDVTFTVTDAYLISVNRGLAWDFGDGTTFTAFTISATHVYLSTGTFSVSVVYWVSSPFAGGLIQRTSQALVTVSERRRVSFTPDRPLVGQAVTFQAENFLGQYVRWDFGDGTPSHTSGLTTAHTYQRPGVFTVTALDNGGNSVVPIRALVTVQAGEVVGPRANFRISYLQLRFDDGKAYRVVAKETRGLTAFADIKVEGTGVIHLEWLWDGSPFRQESRALSFARTAVLDSGRLPGLPTHMAGLHEVTLRILSPQVEFTVPVIRYFVTAERAVPAAPLRVVVELTAATGLDGLNLPLDSETVRVPAGSYGILSGILRNEDRSAVEAGLLRVTVDGRISDLQLVRNLLPDETRTFLTSLFHPPDSPPEKPPTVFVSFYDISQKTPVLLVARKITIL